MCKFSCDNRRIHRRKRFVREGNGWWGTSREKGVAEFSHRRFAPFARKSHSKAPRVLVLPPRFIPLLSDDWQCAVRPGLSLLPLFCCSLLHLHSKFSLLFHNFIHFSCQPAIPRPSVCLCKCSAPERAALPFLPSRFRQPSLRVHFTIPPPTPDPVVFSFSSECLNIISN